MSELLVPVEHMLDASPDFSFVGEGDILKISSILGQKNYNNLIYVGKTGVGKTANILGIVEAQQKDPEDATVHLPLHMINRKFFFLDLHTVFEGDEDKIRDNIREVFADMSVGGRNVLVVEDASDLMSAIDDHQIPGVVSSFMDQLRSNNFQTILMVRVGMGGDNSTLNDILNSHSEIEEQFSVLVKESPDKDDVAEMLLAQRGHLGDHHDGMIVSSEVCQEVVDLTHNYPSLPIYRRMQPARSMRIMDHIASKFITERMSDEISTKQKDVIRELQGLNREMMEIEKIEHVNRAKLKELHEDLIAKLKEDGYDKPTDDDISTHKTQKMKEKEEMLRFCRKDLESITERIHNLTASINMQLEIAVSDVKRIFSDMSGIPSDDLNESQSEKILQFNPKMKKRVFGQDHAINKIDASIRKSAAGLKDPGKPIGSFLFLGSSGVGKTHIAESVAVCQFDDKDSLTSFDMSEFMEKHTVSRLIGAPPGYAGYGSGGMLTNAVRKNPYQVILLDEVEKAHPDVFKILLQLLDKGRLSDELGTVDFRNCIIIMTTNKGQHLSFEDSFDQDTDEGKETINSILLEVFAQELLNRIDEKVVFKALPDLVIGKIVNKTIADMNERVESRNVTITMDGDTITEIVEDRYIPKEGARQVKSFVENKGGSEIATLILEGKASGKVIDMKYNSESDTFDLNLSDKQED